MKSSLSSQLLNQTLINNLDVNKRYLLAVSGGVDSCSLYHLMDNLGYDFILVHINHHTRGSENALEQMLVENMAKRDQRPYVVADFYYNHVGNFHDQARNFRLKTYHYLVNHYQLDGVVLAHHLDDNWETIMMHQDAILPSFLKPKTKLDNGLNIYRPLLDVSKENIIDYAKNSGIIWYEDSSNKKDIYTRNFYRLNCKKNIKEKRIIINEIVDRYQQYQKYLTKSFNLKTLRSMEDKNLYLYAQLRKSNCHHLSTKLIVSINQALDGQGYKEFVLPHNHKLYQVYEQLIVDAKFPEPTGIVIDGGNNLSINGYNISSSKYQVTDITNHDVIKHNDIKKIKRKMLKAKIPRPLRDSWPIKINNEYKFISLVNQHDIY